MITDVLSNRMNQNGVRVLSLKHAKMTADIGPESVIAHLGYIILRVANC